MKEIDGFKVNVINVGNFQWVIQVDSPDKTRFITQVQAGQINEEMAYQHFKREGKNYFIDI